MGKIATVDDLGRCFRELACRVQVNDYYRAFHTTPQHDGSPHIEQEGSEFHFVVTERGTEFQRRKTTDPDEILYWLLDGITQVAATQYELQHRVEELDGRKIWFAYQEKLLCELKPEWGVRKQQEHIRILTDHPFRDAPFVREQETAPNFGERSR